MGGSTFNSPTKSNYIPIEGECLWVASALHRMRYYTKGCDRLLISTDHKPLLGVLNDRSMNSLDNPRLMRLKRRLWVGGSKSVTYQGGSVGRMHWGHCASRTGPSAG